jgi:hypothetical protein
MHSTLSKKSNRSGCGYLGVDELSAFLTFSAKGRFRRYFETAEFDGFVARNAEAVGPVCEPPQCIINAGPLISVPVSQAFQ